MSTQPVQQTPHKRQFEHTRLFIIGAGMLAVLLLIAILSISSNSTATLSTGVPSVAVLAIPAFLAGVLSFLSPCTLPILPAYFAFTFQARKQSIVMMTVAFFLGLATTMTIFGASATALSALVFTNREALTLWGGLIVVGFGIMSLLGKGFAGPKMQDRPVASAAGSYIYGATFALGWTACVGPILGALLMLLASQGVAIVQGALLAIIYSMGLGMPLILLATFFSRLGTGSRFWQIVRGRGFEVQAGPWKFYLHTTSIASGILLIVMGTLLATGQLTRLSELTQYNSFSQWWLGLETEIHRLFGL